MRLLALCLAALLALPQATPARAQSLPPHAWLFGTWTGGMFPVAANMPAALCYSQPVVIFTRDLVMRATLTEQTLTQREIETARAVPGGIEFRFIAGPTRDASILGLGTPGALAGFGCETSDILHVQRRGENEIMFPGCADFPNPLVRCH